ncbi:MAG TPA: TIM barrel protein [Vicinamibacterales bacterium]|nr:TIM barrel protein [Vicinamibacterales bacterium]
MVAKRRFGVSTHLYDGQRLTREHLLEIAAFGFDTVEIDGRRTHLDFANDAVVADLQQWLAEARLDLLGLRVPAGAADDEVEHALFVGRRMPFAALTLQIARPREAAKKIDRLLELAEPLGVRIAIDSTSEGLSPIGSLVHFVEGFDEPLGIALDFARAQRDGDLVDAIEIAAEHLATIRLPVDGRIDWPSALTAVQKVGYEGPVLVEPPRGAPKTALAQARQARDRFEKQLCTFI